MNSSEIKNLIAAFFASLNDQDFGDLTNYLSPDVVFHFPGTKLLTGPKKAVRLLRIIYRRYSDLVFAISDTIVEDNRATAIWENAGTDRKGNQYKNHGVTILTFRDNKVVYMSDYFKDTSFTTNS